MSIDTTHSMRAVVPEYGEGSQSHDSNFITNGSANEGFPTYIRTAMLTQDKESLKACGPGQVCGKDSDHRSAC